MFARLLLFFLLRGLGHLGICLTEGSPFKVCMIRAAYSSGEQS